MTAKANVDAYLADLPPATRASLQKLRKTIKAAAPKAVERISYAIPGYFLNGPLVFFGAFRQHLSFYGVNRANFKLFAKELAGFEISGTTIHFSPAKPLPAALVKKIVKLRMTQNLERVAAKSLRAKGAK
jgi:uncharacterized protein YdhG (YjbR/CyaY superfamily)